MEGLSARYPCSPLETEENRHSLGCLILVSALSQTVFTYVCRGLSQSPGKFWRTIMKMATTVSFKILMQSPLMIIGSFLSMLLGVLYDGLCIMYIQTRYAVCKCSRRISFI